MMLALILVLSMQVLTGLFVHNDVARVGPLFGIFPANTVDMLVSAHGLFFTFLMTLVTVHIAAVAAYWIVKRRNLVGPMTTGIRHLPPCAEKPEIMSARRALPLFLLAVTIATLIAQL
jgi:cytochrome b